MRATSNDARPTVKQLRYLRVLAQRTGTTFAYPQSRAQASAEIERLRRHRGTRPLPTDVEMERRDAAVYATSPRDHELAGHGSSTRWAHSKAPEELAQEIRARAAR